MTNEHISDIKELLKTPQKIAIIPHRNPDGDAIGSSLALYHFLKNNHYVSVIAPNDYPDFLKWLPSSNDVKLFDKQNAQAKRVLESATIIFLLDFNALSRIGQDMQGYVEQLSATFIMIDHHQQPDTSITSYIYSDTSICSTCQMVYHFLEKLGETDSVNSEIATCLYTGIMTDTGSFRFPSTTSETHRIVADLIDKGANNTQIHNKVYDVNSYGRLQLLGKALSNLTVIENYRVAYIKLSQKELNQFDFKKGDTEGFVNYALSLKGIVLAAIFIEDFEQKIIKISFRSKGEFSVNQFARNHFNGGGHTNAAGGRSTETLEKTITNFLSILPQYKEQINKSDEEN